MNPIKLKICGMRDPQNIQEVSELRPDYLGFIFYKKSKRFVGDDFELNAEDLNGIQRVGVFVNEELTNLISIAEKYELDFVQLHGDETPDFCAKANKSGLKIIKAIGVHSGFDFKTLEGYKPFVTHFLFDTKSEAYGGTGNSFDWELLNQYDHELSFFLSGGLGLEEINLLKSVDFHRWNVHAIDVNSKFEISPGVKDVERLRALRKQLP